MTSNRLDLVDFQLYLLKTMQPPGALVDSALIRLNSTTEHMRSSAESISKAIMPGKGGSAHALKPILHDALIKQIHGTESETFLYRLPLWGEFDFRIELDNLPYMKRVEFVGAAAMNEKVAPWKFLEMHLAGRFGEIQEVDSWGTYNSYTARDVETGNHLFLRFSWGLLQEVDIMTDRTR